MEGISTISGANRFKPPSIGRGACLIMNLLLLLQGAFWSEASRERGLVFALKRKIKNLMIALMNFLSLRTLSTLFFFRRNR